MIEHPVFIEIDVEYVRKETLVFAADPDNGIASVGSPAPVARVLRSLNYYMHQGRSLAKGEDAKLLRFRVISGHDWDCEAGNPDAPCNCESRLLDRAINKNEVTG